MTVEEDNDGFLRIKYIQGLEAVVEIRLKTHAPDDSQSGRKYPWPIYLQTLVSPLKMETICDVLCAAMRLIHGVWILG